MSGLLPAPGEPYRGHPAAPVVLALTGALTVLPGLVHTLLPDGGAGLIAGIDLSQGGRAIVAVFAWAGATQLVWGALMLAVALRYRALTALVLLLVLVERALIAANLWWLKPPAGYPPPEAYATLAALPLIALALAAALRRRAS